MKNYHGDRPSQTTGRTRLIVGNDAVNEPVPLPTNPAQTASPIPPFNAPERRKWERKRAKKPPDRSAQT
jgi:hypothetical protein